MSDKIERNLGEQPLRKIMEEHTLTAHMVVSASSVQITHKMVGRAMKGRRLTAHVQKKILAAVNAATAQNYTLSDLFNY